MTPWKAFEADFRKSADRQGIFQFRPKDCPGAWHQNQDDRPENITFTARNEYDLILYHIGNLLTLELKSFAGTSFPFTAISETQVKGLLKAARHEGVVAGVILNFRKYSRTFFVPIDLFVREMESGPRKSINLDRATALGVEIEQQLLKVHFKYNLLAFIARVGPFELEDASE